MATQLYFPVEISKEAYDFGTRSSGEKHGVVLTKPHIVELILDLVGYKENEEVLEKRLLEPSCGTGAFLIPAVRRLIGIARKKDVPISKLRDQISAFDIDSQHVRISRGRVVSEIQSFGYSTYDAETLANDWVKEGDFLLVQISEKYQAIVGNPPYIRIEQLSKELQNEYRKRYPSLFDRADIYVAFIERCLALLERNGLFSFICTDRWVKNQYGAKLRCLIANSFRIHAFIDMQTVSPFETEVSAYPSVFLIGHGTSKNVDVFSLSEGSPQECREINQILTGKKRKDGESVQHIKYDKWFDGNEPWIISSSENFNLLRDLEKKFPLIEKDEEVKIGIGVATGCDRVYVIDKTIDIEPDRLVPLVMRDNIIDGRINRPEKFVINTFQDNGKIICLSQYPKLSKYFSDWSEEIRGRHVSKKNSVAWFRTIDRVYPELVKVPKILIPDIAGANEIAIDEGKYHPHHNLYYVASKAWDIELLAGILSSKMALFFIWSYAVKMRGGYLRFQAQYLRKIRLPERESISKAVAKDIVRAFQERDFEKLDVLSARIYGVLAPPQFDFVDSRQKGR